VEDGLAEVPLAAFGVAALLAVPDEPPLVVPAGVVATGVVATGVVAAGLVAAGVVAAVVAVPFKQLTSVPVTVNGALCANVPVESRRLSPRLVLGG